MVAAQVARRLTLFVFTLLTLFFMFREGNTLTAQMSAADASIATLESQLSYFTSLFTDEQQNATNNAA